ncbi:MAG: hypothetical protein AAF610_01775 [Pseudomonadota bacterium]
MDGQTRIEILERPRPLTEIFSGFSDSAQKVEKFEVIERQRLELDGLPAELIETRAKGRDRKGRLILISGDTSDSLVLTADYSNGGTNVPALKTMFSNVHWEPSRPLNYLEGLRFRLTDVPGLRIAQREARAVILTASGRPRDDYSTDQWLGVTWVPYDTAPPENQESFARSLFDQTDIATDIRFGNASAERLDNRPAFKILGRGAHLRFGFDVGIYQIVVFYRDGYALARGLGDPNNPESAINLFDAVLSSLRKE